MINHDLVGMQAQYHMEADLTDKSKMLTGDAWMHFMSREETREGRIVHLMHLTAMEVDGISAQRKSARAILVYAQQRTHVCAIRFDLR